MIQRAESQTSSVSLEIFSAALGESIDFAIAARSEVAGLGVGSSIREKLSKMLWQQSLEDALAIGEMIRLRLTGSARALLRPQLEALLRGGWSRLCATDEELDACVQGDSTFPTLSKVIEGLRGLRQPWSIGHFQVPLQQLERNALGVYHDLTHRGVVSVARMLCANASTDDAFTAEEAQVLHLSVWHGAFAAGSILVEESQTERADHLLNWANSLSKQLVPRR